MSTSMSVLMREQQVREAKLRDELEQARIEIAVQRVRIEMQQEQQQQLLLLPNSVSVQQLTALQSRLLSLHAAELLADDELSVLEDLCADYLEVVAAVGEAIQADGTKVHSITSQMAKLVALSEGIAADESCARQLRRKFCA
jgi:hypothetical protein